MKYVMIQDKAVKIDGIIANSGTSPSFDKSYSNEDIILTKDFLTFEHTPMGSTILMLRYVVWIIF